MNRTPDECMIELTPHVGLGNTRLGDAESSVRKSLLDERLVFDQSMDPYRWELDAPWCTLSFANDPMKRLVQISTSSESSRVYGHPIVGMRLDEALVALNIQRFDDTVWSVGEVEIDFESGEPFIDSDQRDKRTSHELLHIGTLWIKSLGLGLSFHAGTIDSIAIRESKYVPEIGYGPLDEQTLVASSDPKLQELLAESMNQPTQRSSAGKFPFRALLGIATAITAAVLCWVIYTMISDYRSWVNATAVMGRVIEMKPEGPFPDELVVQYLMPDEELALATVPSQYASAREIGQEVELLYRKENPSLAMTRLQSRDYFNSISMDWLIYTIPLLSLELIYLFPSLRSRRTYR